MIVALALALLANNAAYLADWKQIETAIRDRYYARESRKKEMEDLLASCATKAPFATSHAEFSKAVNDMMDKFKDSHFGFYTDEEQAYYAISGIREKDGPELWNVGAWFKKTPSGWAVQYTFAGTEADRAGLHKSDEILSVDGEELRPVDSFKNKDKVTLKYRRDGVEHEVELKTSKSTFNELALTATRKSAKVIDFEGKKFGYFKPTKLLGDDIQNALLVALFGPLYNTDGFVLDLRDGFGGRPDGFGDPFFRPALDVEVFSGNKSFGVQHSGYDKPLVVLINDGTRSAREMLALSLQHAKRASLVGQPSLGAVLGMSPIAVDKWGIMEIPMVELRVAGKRLEGSPVKPDVTAPDAWKGETDLILEAGLKTLRQMSK